MSSEHYASSQKSLRGSTLANLAARVVSAMLALFAIPILVRTLGAEAYGLVGLGLAMEALFGLLDFGLSSSVNREVARNLAARSATQTNRDLLRTLEVVYWPIALVILLLVAGGGGWLSEHLVRTVTLSEETVQFAFVMLALSLAARWPISLYQGVLRGVEAQILMNATRIVGSVARVAGGVAAVLIISPSIRVFFIVDILGSVLELMLVTTAAWKALPKGTRSARFNKAFIRSIWRYALGFTALSMLIQLLYWSGIFVVARYLPLNEVGFYSVALSLTAIIMYVPYAIHSATFPRFAGEAQRRDMDSFATTFHQALFVSTLWSVIVGMPILFFGTDILYLWTRSWSVATMGGMSASLLALGYLLHQYWSVHYVALTAAGRFRSPLLLTACVVPLSMIATLKAVTAAGAPGAAATWAIANALLAIGYISYAQRDTAASALTAWSFRPLALMLCSGAIFAGAHALSHDSSVVGRLFSATLASSLSLTVGLLWLRPAGLDLPRRPREFSD